MTKKLVLAFAALSMLVTLIPIANAQSGYRCQRDSNGNYYCCRSSGFGCSSGN